MPRKKGLHAPEAVLAGGKLPSYPGLLPLRPSPLASSLAHLHLAQLGWGQHHPCPSSIISLASFLRLRLEKELALTQLSQALVAELTELVLRECVRETCSQEWK